LLCTHSPPAASSLHDPAPTETSTRSLHDALPIWVERLREALAGDGFVLHYLPVLGLQGDNGELYEAHLRIEVNGELVRPKPSPRSEEHTSELQSRENLVCRLLLEKKKNEETEIMI